MEKMRKFLFLCALLLGVVQVAVADDETTKTGTDITPSGYNWEKTGALPTISSVLTPKKGSSDANETAEGYKYSSEYANGLVGLFSVAGNNNLKNGISVVDFGGKVGRVLAVIGNGATSLESDFKNTTNRSIDLTGVGSNPGHVRLNFFFPSTTPTSTSNASTQPTDNYVKVKIVYNNYKVKLNSISLINNLGNAVGQSITETDTINSLTRWKSAELVSWCPYGSSPLRLVVNISNELNNSDGGFFIKEISFTSYEGTPSTYLGTVTPTKHELSLENTIEFASAADYATYYDENAYVMPTGVHGGPVTVSGETATVTYQYAAGYTVPAKTPLLLKRTDTNLTSATISYSNTGTATECGTNNLKGGGDTDACELNGDIKQGSGHIYYMLSYDSNGANQGFYYGADNGASFNIYRHRCFLDVESTSSAKGFVIEEKTTTGIENIENATPDAAVYTLSGIRMSGKQLPAGIYVRGGKKFVVK